MSKFLIAAAMAACTIATPALAQQSLPSSDGVSATFTANLLGLQPGETLIADYDNTTGGVTCTPNSCLIQSDSNTSGVNSIGSGEYLSVVGGNSATFSFSNALSELGLDLGSADNYNTFVLDLADGTMATFSGSVIDGSSNTAPDVRPTGRLTFVATAGNPIVGLMLGSTQNSLETDNLGGTAAVPEPATWAMMLLGFGAIGVSLRRRNRPTAQFA